MKKEIVLHNYKDVLDGRYLLLVTSNSVEKKAVNRLIQNACNLELPFSTRGCRIGQVGEHLVIHITGDCGASGEFSVANLVNRCLFDNKVPKPNCVLLLGVCWGNSNSTKIKDVVISNDIHKLNKCIYREDKIEYQKTVETSSIPLEWFKDSSIKGNVKLGSMGSLEALLTSSNFRDELLLQNPDLIAGEMEAFGFVSNLKEIPWLVIKAVSDHGGDEFTRDEQENSLIGITEIIPKVMEILYSNGILSTIGGDKDSLSLYHSLLGKSFSLSTNDFSVEQLNDYLNNKFSSILIYKLKYYSSISLYDERFLYDFCDLILEVIQNEFRHGTTTKVDLNFTSKGVNIGTNGKDFDLKLLSGLGGGTESWCLFTDEYIKSNLVSYKFDKKKHKFTLTKLDAAVQKIIDECSVSIIESTIGAHFIKPNIIQFNENCESVFVDDTTIYMQSRRRVLVKEVEGLLKDGLMVYLAVRSKYGRRPYLHLSEKYYPALRILEVNA